MLEMCVGSANIFRVLLSSFWVFKNRRNAIKSGKYTEIKRRHKIRIIPLLIVLYEFRYVTQCY
jgi:hypothetical protein